MTPEIRTVVDAFVSDLNAIVDKRTRDKLRAAFAALECKEMR